MKNDFLNSYYMHSCTPSSDIVLYLIGSGREAHFAQVLIFQYKHLKFAIPQDISKS